MTTSEFIARHPMDFFITTVVVLSIIIIGLLYLRHCAADTRRQREQQANDSLQKMRRVK
jgi:hypothetical protein